MQFDPNRKKQRVLRKPAASLCQDEGHEFQRGVSRVGQGMAGSRGSMGHIARSHVDKRPVIVVAAMAGEDIIGFAFAVVLMIPERTVRFQRDMSEEAAMFAPILRSKQRFQQGIAFASGFAFGAFRGAFGMMGYHVGLSFLQAFQPQ